MLYVDLKLPVLNFYVDNLHTLSALEHAPVQYGCL